MGPVMIGSSEGGMDIEAVAEKNPDAIVKLPIDIATGLSLEAATDFARKMGIPDGCRKIQLRYISTHHVIARTAPILQVVLVLVCHYM